MFFTRKNSQTILFLILILACSTFMWLILNDDHVNVDNSDVGERVSNSDSKVNTVTKCQKRDLRLADGLPATGLLSFPGSGNTWTRHMLQQITGMVYLLFTLYIVWTSSGFPYSCDTNTRISSLLNAL